MLIKEPWSPRSTSSDSLSLSFFLLFLTLSVWSSRLLREQACLEHQAIDHYGCSRHLIIALSLFPFQLYLLQANHCAGQTASWAIGSIKRMLMWVRGWTTIRLRLVKWTSALETKLLCSPPNYAICLTWTWSISRRLQSHSHGRSLVAKCAHTCSGVVLLKSAFLFQYNSIFNITLLDLIQMFFCFFLEILDTQYVDWKKCLN